MSQPQDSSFTCEGCGTPFGVNPRVARALAGSAGDPKTPHLCWVCARLHNSAVREMTATNKAFEQAFA